jgi:hypothetical protein
MVHVDVWRILRLFFLGAFLLSGEEDIAMHAPVHSSPIGEIILDVVCTVVRVCVERRIAIIARPSQLIPYSKLEKLVR